VVAGFVTSKVACCGQGPYNGIGLCTPASNVCPNRDVYAYWDAFHPTERANRIIVGQFMHGSTDHITPMNISTILAMDNTQQGLGLPAAAAASLHPISPWLADVHP
jgi:phospholipase/lecithinase/hemolysin